MRTLPNQVQCSLFDTPEVNQTAAAKVVVKKSLDASTIKSIDQKTKLSQFLSPYSSVTNSLSNPSDYPKKPPELSPQIKIVQYGTGTGKTYGALKQYLLFQSMGYSDEHKSKHGLLKRNPCKDNFTNAVFVTPNKNQIKFDDSLIKEMLSLGITPLSVLSIPDNYKADNVLWVGGKYTTIQRLNDLVKTTHLILKTHGRNPNVKDWQRHHVGVIKSLLINISYAVKEIEKLEFKRKELSVDDYISQLEVLSGVHNKSIQMLIMTILNNIFNKNKAIDSGLLKTIEDSDTNIKDDSDVIINELDDEDRIKLPVMDPMDEDEVFDDIFAKAKPKTHYDDLLIKDEVISEWDDFDSMLASLKKEIIRVYAPLNYAMYLPSLICMTSDKFRVKPSFYRKSFAKNQNDWKYASGDYMDFSELIGDKVSFDAAMIAIPSTVTNARAKQIDLLKETIMAKRVLGGRRLNVDIKSTFTKKNINFYVIIDESNALFEKCFAGDDIGDGVVKRILDKFSITDILSCVERKYREFSNQIPQDIDCYEQNRFFFESMFAYLETYCEIDPRKVFKVANSQLENDAYLLKFDFPPNILYIDNNEASSVTSMVKNAFSVTAKKFIDKEKLQSIYVCKRGQHRYLSINQKNENDITLYDLYQIIVSILFAAIKVESGENEGGRFDANKRQAFRLDLGGASSNGEVRRQNEPLAALLVYASNNAAKYTDWLASDHLNNNPEAIIDDWFAYIQTKLLFTLNLNKDFDASPDKGHQTKTFIDIKLHLITHHPEIDILKMAHDTTNYIHIMSATSGKERAYSGQYNIKFLKDWGRDLDVQVSTPEYDHAYDIDYRELFTEFREHRTTMRDIDVITYENTLDIEELKPKQTDSLPAPINHSHKQLMGINTGRSTNLSVKTLKPHLLAVNESLGDQKKGYIESGSFNDQAFDNAIAGLLLSFKRKDTTLLISYRMDLFRVLLGSIRAQFYSSSSNIKTLNNAISNKQTSVTFSHSIFGDFQLPLLNEYLLEHKGKLTNNQAGQVKHLVISQYTYLVDMIDLGDKVDLPANKVVRLALFDSTIDKLMTNYRDYFVIKQMTHKGVVKDVFTTIVSYNKAAALGLNNTIVNEVVDTTQDVNRLFLASLAYWTKINDQSNKDKNDGLDGWNKIENTLIYMRYLAAISKREPKIITEFDSNLSGHEGMELLKIEHDMQKGNNFKQTLGRTERKDSNNDFQSEIILPLEDLKEQTKINFLSYKLDKNLSPRADKTDFAYISMNNYAVLKAGADLICATSTTDEKRLRLEDSTLASKNRIEEFVDGVTGFMGKLIRAARSGDKGIEAKQLADAAIDFDIAYRESTILRWPTMWLQRLSSQALVTDQDLLSKLGWSNVNSYLNDMFINLQDYKDGDTLEVYQHVKGIKKLGLTDFFGNHGNTTTPYKPSSFILPRIDAAHFNKNDARLARVVNCNNNFISESKDIYDKGNNPDVLLHPSMVHMALGNVGEHLFSCFLESYRGNFVDYAQKDIVARFGYQFYEMFDFWLYNRESSQFVCVDIKNFSHKENVHQTQKIMDSGDRKVSKIENELAIFETGSQEELSGKAREMIEVFRDSNEMHVVFVNVRHNENSTKKLIQRHINVDGRALVINIHYLTLFQTVRYLPAENRSLISVGRYEDGSPKKIPNRKIQLTINPRLMSLLGIDKSQGIESVFEPVVFKNDEEYDITASTAVIFPDLFNVDTDSSDINNQPSRN